jgi:ferredoxin-NADP reductase
MGTIPDTARRPRLLWQHARVAAVRDETPSIRTLTVDVPGWRGHRPGQHVDVRLTAPDGYQAQRSYSIASAPRAGGLELTVERLDDGEVSWWLAGEARQGDAFELRGPIGGYFVWDVTMDGPVQLVAGGSGVVPLLSMVRHRVAAGGDQPMRLLYSARSLDDVVARGELVDLAARDPGFELICTLTRARPPGWDGYARRVDRELLTEALWEPAARALTYVCGPTQFVESVSGTLVELGYQADRIRTERFGPTGTP